MNYLERYNSGEREQVWAELVAQNTAIRVEPLATEANTVATEMMRRARYNISLLIERLHILDYQFAFSAWNKPSSILTKHINETELIYGILPLTLRMWFDIVGEMCFIGAHPRLACYLHLVPTEHQGPVSDPLMVGKGEIWVNEEEEDSSNEVDQDSDQSSDPIFLFALDQNYKSNYSGGSSNGIVIPASGFDAPLNPTVRWNGLYFIPYLRTCFEWGGLPGLKSQPEAAAAQAELAFLTKDLLPI